MIYEHANQISGEHIGLRLYYPMMIGNTGKPTISPAGEIKDIRKTDSNVYIKTSKKELLTFKPYNTIIIREEW